VNYCYTNNNSNYFLKEYLVNIYEKKRFVSRLVKVFCLVFLKWRRVLSRSYTLNFAELFNSKFSRSRHDFQEQSPRGEILPRNIRHRNREKLKFP